jgi:hypothetical protein
VLDAFFSIEDTIMEIAATYADCQHSTKEPDALPTVEASPRRPGPHAAPEIDTGIQA